MQTIPSKFVLRFKSLKSKILDDMILFDIKLILGSFIYCVNKSLPLVITSGRFIFLFNKYSFLLKKISFLICL